MTWNSPKKVLSQTKNHLHMLLCLLPIALAGASATAHDRPFASGWCDLHSPLKGCTACAQKAAEGTRFWRTRPFFCCCNNTCRPINA